MLFRNKFLLAKIEGTYGSDVSPASTDAILTSNCQIQPYAGPVVSRDLDRSTLGAQTQINTNPQVQITFDVEIAGSGSAGTAPAYDSLLRACGFAGAAGSPNSYVYVPVSSGWESVTIYFYHDGQRHKIIGARGNMSLSLTRGEIPRYSFTFTGQYSTPTAASGTANTTDFVAPVPVTNSNTPTFTMGGSPLTDLVAESFTFDMGNNVIARNVINDYEIFITDRNVTGSTVIEAVLPSTKDWFTDAVESDSAINLQTLQLIHGTTSGNIVQFDAPAVQVATIAQNESDGLIVYNLGLNFTPSSGNDELTITVY